MANESHENNLAGTRFTRRTFVGTGLVGGSAVVAGMALSKKARADVSEDLHYDAEPDPVADVSYVHSVCLGCRSDCGIKVRVKDGVAVKIEGNPYHPNNSEADERLTMADNPDDYPHVNGRLCAKGQAAIETLYNPYRLKQPLRRVGARGEGKWEAITWDEALTELASKMSAVYSTTAITGDYGDNFGPTANKVVFSRGRLEEGAEDFVKRFFNKSFGTINAPQSHDSICEAARHVATYLATGKASKHLKPDVLNSSYIICWGTSPLEAGFAMQSFARKLMQAVNDNGAKVVAIDPRFSATAAKGTWVPVKPGADAALAFGMIHYILENELYDETFLTNPNSTAAAADGEKCWTDATFLVRSDTGKYLTVKDLDGSSSTDQVVWDGATTVSAASATVGELYVDAMEVELADGTTVEVSSAFQLFTNRVNEHERWWYANECDVSESTIETIAAEFAANGKTAVVDMYRGVCAHTNGYYSSAAVFHLNTLVGNFDHKGGMGKGGGSYSYTTGDGYGVDVTSVTGGYSASGVAISRAGTGTVDYWKTAESTAVGAPARRPWFPFGYQGNFQEILPSIADGYPYDIAVLITYFNDTVYTSPAARQKASEILADTSKVPYFVAVDVDMNETSIFADLVLPDVTFLEQWATTATPPTNIYKASGFRQPVVGTVNKAAGAAPALAPYLPDTRELVDWLLELGRKLGLPGIGADALGAGRDLNNAWDWYGTLLSNLVADYNAESGSAITTADVEARGGIFEAPGSEYSGEMLAHTLAKRINFYVEELATTRDSMTGEYYDPLPKYERPQSLLGDDIEDLDTGFPYQLITYKPVFHTQSRTAMCPSLMMIQPENFVEMAASDGVALGLETGDQVRVTGPNGASVTGPVKLSQGVKPGVVAISNSYGHWEMNSKPQTIDGVVQPYDASRAAGIHGATVMRLDDDFGDVCLQDRVSGQASFNDTWVRVEKA